MSNSAMLSMYPEACCFYQTEHARFIFVGLHYTLHLVARTNHAMMWQWRNGQLCQLETVLAVLYFCTMRTDQQQLQRCASTTMRTKQDAYSVQLLCAGTSAFPLTQ